MAEMGTLVIGGSPKNIFAEFVTSKNYDVCDFRLYHRVAFGCLSEHWYQNYQSNFLGSKIVKFLDNFSSLAGLICDICSAD